MRHRSILGLVLLLLMAINCLGQANGKAAKPNQRSVRNSLSDSISLIGWQEVYDSLPILRIVEISDTQFFAYKNAYHSQVILDSSRIVWGDSTFSIRTSKALLEYFNAPVYDRSGSHDCDFFYQGYHPQLDLYFLSSYWHGEFTLGSNLWIDARRNIGVCHLPHSDGCFPAPVFSPSNQYLAIYDEDVFDDGGCFLGVVRIRKDRRGIHFEEYASTSTDPVQELVWINEHAFAMRVKQNMGYNQKKGLNDYQDLYWKAALPGWEESKDRPSQ